MTSRQNSLHTRLAPFRRVRRILLSICFVLILFPQSAHAIEIPDVQAHGAEAWLVTFGPGEIYWERFGHNAIWLREPAAGLDHTFNFGYFDFEQDDFFQNFMRGRMLYFSVAQPAEREFRFYREQNRSIRLQRLKLTNTQYQQLRDYLLNEIRPENRDYRYDYYLNNCSTRIRDALDIALDGALSAQSKAKPAELNFRDQTRRLTQMQFWYYLGLELGLGYPVDREISRWDEMFIPMVVADELAGMSQESDEALITVDTMLFTSTSVEPAIVPEPTWFRYLLLGLLVTGLAWLSGKFMSPVWLQGLSGAWVLVSSTSGMILAALWLFTDHEVANYNANLLLFNPLVIFALVPYFKRTGAVLLAGGVAMGFLLLLIPTHQYNLDVLLLLAPVNLSVAAFLLKKHQSKQ